MMKNAYHGTADASLVAGVVSRGIPDGVIADILTVNPNDTDGRRACFRDNDDYIAAVVLDLNLNKAGLISLTEDFVDAARSLTRQAGSLLVLDEVISFRQAFDGLTEARAVDADSVTLGKMIGGGLPIGAVVGKEAVMQLFDPRHPDAVFQSGTFNRNPLSMAAGVATLELLGVSDIGRLNGLGQFARENLAGELEPWRWEVRGLGSTLRVFPRGVLSAPAPTQHALWWAAYERGGVMSSANLVSLSTPMGRPEVQTVIDVLAEAVRRVAKDS
jgi:glutamate-1-semialdehyde 2,1-aminomutase